MQEKILRLAAEIIGEESPRQELLEALCTIAEAAWRERLRDGVAAEDCSEAFCCAAALTAAADYIAARTGSGVTSFSAGEISIQEKSGGEDGQLAQSLRQTAQTLMRPYAVPEGFCFKGVRG